MDLYQATQLSLSAALGFTRSWPARIARAAALVSGFLAFAVVAAQAAPPDPARLVASIYADGKEGAVWSQWLDGKRREERFSHALTSLWARCDVRAHTINDELGQVDFDVASQGPTVKAAQPVPCCVSLRVLAGTEPAPA